MTTISSTETMTARRDAVIAEHIEAECHHDVERALRTFSTPHYHVYPLGVDAPGAESVADLLSAVFAAFSDFRFTPARTYHAEDAVVVEGRITGTHDGPWAGIEATGRSVDVPTCCIFHFEEDRLMSESVYFDHATLLQAITAS